MYGTTHGGKAPPQGDGTACGVFVLSWISCAVLGVDMDRVCQTDIPWLRWHFAREILNVSAVAPPIEDSDEPEEGDPTVEKTLVVYHCRSGCSGCMRLYGHGLREL